MKNSNLPSTINFNLPSLKSYLQGKGWTFKSVGDESVVTFSPQDNAGNNLSYLLPPETMVDFKDLAYQVFKGISSVEKCELQSVVDEFNDYLSNQISSAQSVMKLKFGSAKENSISLQETESIAKHSRLLIAHSIDNESEHMVFRERASNRASKMSQSFEVGQQKGSFIFVIRSPHEYEQGSFDGLIPTPSLQTKAMIRLARGMQWLHDNPNQVDNYQQVLRASEAGLNANMALHLNELFRAVDTSEKYFTFNINSNFTVEHGLRLISYKVGFREIENFKHIYNLLSKPREEVLEFDARVVKLASNNPLQDSLVHKISIIVEDGESPFFNKQIQIELDKDTYHRAVQGHGDGEVFKVRGRFKINGTKIELKDLYQFGT